MRKNVEHDSSIGIMTIGLVVLAGVYLILVLAAGAGGKFLVAAGAGLLVLERVVVVDVRVLRWIVRGGGAAGVVLGVTLLLLRA